MATLQASRHCRVCGHRTLHQRGTFSAGWGIFLSLLTFGLFIPVWMLFGVWDALFGRWRCQSCGAGRRT